MRDEQIATLAIACILGTGVLGSYFPVIRDQVTKYYDHWLQIPDDTRYMFYALQLLAAVGFIVWIIHYCSKESEYKTGLFSYSKSVVPVLVTLLLVASIAGPSVQYCARVPSAGTTVLTSGSLIVTACAPSCFLLVSWIDNPAWYATLGLLLFCLVTVLGDGVGWNARFLLRSPASSTALTNRS